MTLVTDKILKYVITEMLPLKKNNLRDFLSTESRNQIYNITNWEIPVTVSFVNISCRQCIIKSILMSIHF